MSGAQGGNAYNAGNFNGAGGGGGGAGVYIRSWAPIVVSSQVTVAAGNGGAGASSRSACTSCAIGSGGGGGNGIAFAAGGELANYGIIRGGNGGGAGLARTSAGASNIADGGGGGHAVAGSDLVISNYGILTGGAGNGGGQQGAAIFWSGGSSNQLRMYTGSQLNGAIWLNAGSAAIVEYAADRTLNNWIIFNGAGTFNTNGFNTTASGPVTGSGSVTKTGIGVLTLSGTNSYSSGTTINQGTVSVAADSNLGAANGGLTINGGTLQSTGSFTASRQVNLGSNGATVTTAANTTLGLSGVLQNLVSATSGALTKAGDGVLALSGNNTYTGNTTVSAGSLNITGNGSLAKSKVVLNNGTLDVSGTNTGASILSLVGKTTGTLAVGAKTLTILSAADDFAGTVTGSGGVTLQSGMETFSGQSTAYTGTVTANDKSTLAVTGSLGKQGSQAQINAGGRLIGTGTLGGDVNVSDMGILSPGVIQNTTTGELGTGTLSIGGGLTLAQNSQINFQFGSTGTSGGQYNDLVDVGGNLTLDGKLNISVTPGRTFNVGIYRLFDYQGTLTSNVLDVAAVPTGFSASDLYVQTSIDKQVNLVNSTGVRLRFWDGDNGARNDGHVQGGDGTWRNDVNDAWTLTDGAQNADWSNQSLAVFMGQAGKISVTNTDGDVNAAGMQFATDGYTLNDGVITLFTTTPAVYGSQLTVGDGTSKSDTFITTVNSVLAGNSGIRKTGFGTLVLGGSNTYTGDTLIADGAVQVSASENLGSTSGKVIFDGGKLATTTSFTQSRAVEINGPGGNIDTAANTTLLQSGDVSGAGALTKAGKGTLTMVKNNTYSGGTTISAGTLQLGNGGTSGSVSGDITNDGELALNRSDSLILDGVITGTGSVTQQSSGTSVLTGNSTYSGGTTISSGTLQLGNGGTSGSILGDITNDGELALDRSDTVILDSVISGTGSVSQQGSGTSVLTGNSTYSGGTTISSGTLQLGNGGTSGSLGGDIVNDSTLVLNRSDTQTFAHLITGTGRLVHRGTGTTVLSGSNTYGGGTLLNAGTLQVADNANLGASTGTLRFNGGELMNSATFSLDRAVEIASSTGTIINNTGTVLTVSQGISGAGGLIKAGAGTTLLNGENSYAGGTLINEGTLQVGDGGTTGSLTGDVENNASLVVNRDGKLDMSGALTGSGSLQKEGAGEFEVSGTYSLAGGTWVNQGTLSFSGNSVRTNVIGQQGATLNLRNGATLEGWIDPLDVNIGAGSIWNMNGTQNQNVLDTLTLAGAINSMASTGSFTLRNLTVTNLVGQNGSITLNTQLAGDNSPSDQIIVDGGTASGTTQLAIRNAGGNGAETQGNGILVVQALNGGTTESAAFSLSRPVYAGVYQYSLLRGAKDGSATENWYLSSELVQTLPSPAPIASAPAASAPAASTPVVSAPVATGMSNYRPGVSTAAAAPLVSAAAQMAMMSSFYERSGYYGLHGESSPLASAPCDASLTLWCASESRAWGRYINSNISRKGDALGVAGPDGAQYQQTINGIQFGNDIWRSMDESGNRHYAGLYAALGTSKADVSRADGSRAGQNHLDVYSVGAYFTRIGYNDLWLDAVAQGSLLKVRSQSVDNSGFNTRGYSASTSLEAGYPVLKKNGWQVEPHVRALYQYQTINSAHSGFGDVQFTDYQSLQGSAGVRITQSGSVKNLNYSLWLDPGVGREFKGDARTRFVVADQNVPVTTRTQGGFADIKAGGSISLNKTLALYASANWAPRFDGAETRWGGSVGVRGSW